MSVYIKRTAIPAMDELPKTCADCPLLSYDRWFEWGNNELTELGAHRCSITGELVSNTKREAHCPLRESPYEMKKLKSTLKAYWFWILLAVCWVKVFIFGI